MKESRYGTKWLSKIIVDDPERWWRGERGREGDVPMMVGVRVLVPSVEDEKMKGVRSASASPNPPGRT